MNKMTSLEIDNYLRANGYSMLMDKDSSKLCGIGQSIFTWDLYVNLDENGFSGKYMYETKGEAIRAIIDWDGNGDPGGNWIKYKGEGGERRRVKDEYED